jgi:hypothetical protein
MSRSRAWRSAALAAFLGAACGGDGVNTPELAQALARARPDGELPEQRIARRPLPMSGATAHRAEDRFELTVRLDGGARTLLIERRIDRASGDDDARFRVVQTRRYSGDPLGGREGRTDGREAVFDGKRFASRRAYGPWRERETWRGDHHEWLELAYAVGPALVRAYGPLLTLAPQGAERVAGLPAQRVAVTRNPRMRLKRLSAADLIALRDTDGRWFEWLAATHPPERVSGELLRRDSDGEILAGELSISGTASVEGHTAPFTLTWRRSVEPLAADVSWALPDKLEPARRERPWLMIRSVVRNALADVYKRRASGN